VKRGRRSHLAQGAWCPSRHVSPAPDLELVAEDRLQGHQLGATTWSSQGRDLLLQHQVHGPGCSAQEVGQGVLLCRGCRGRVQSQAAQLRVNQGQHLPVRWARQQQANGKWPLCAGKRGASRCRSVACAGFKLCSVQVVQCSSCAVHQASPPPRPTSVPQSPLASARGRALQTAPAEWHPVAPH
jgi:hypothetical protein